MSFILLALFLGLVTLFNIMVPMSSTTITPLMAGFVGAKDAVAVATLFYCILNIPRVYLFRRYTEWDLVWQLLPASLVGALLGSIFLSGINTHMVAFIILLFLLYFIYQKLNSVFGHEKKPKKQAYEYGGTLIGFLTGLFQGTGVAGVDLRNGYLYSKGLTLQHIHGTTAWVGTTNFALASTVRVFTGDLTFQMARPRYWPYFPS